MKQRQRSSGAALVTVILWMLATSTHGQIRAAPGVANASTFAELSKLIEDAKVNFIVLLANIVLQEPLVISRNTALSIGGQSKITPSIIVCDRIGAGAAFELKTSSKLTITYVNFQNCVTGLKVSVPQQQAPLFPNVRVDNVDFKGPATALEGDLGGALIWQVPAGDLLVHKSSFSGAKARQGGAIYANGGGNVTITNSTFDHNSATDLGGAVMLGANLRVAISFCQFTNNQAEASGGAVVADPWVDLLSRKGPPRPTYVQITSCNFSSNQAASIGGAVLCLHCDLMQIIDSMFDNNLLVGDGPGLGGAVALIANQSEFTMVGAKFTGNSAAFGGALFLNNTCSSLSTCPTTIRIQAATNNKATRAGSFIYSMDQDPMALCCSSSSSPCTKPDSSGCATPGMKDEFASKKVAAPAVAGPPTAVKIVAAQLRESELMVKVVLMGAEESAIMHLPEQVLLTIGLVTGSGKNMVLGGNTSIVTDKGEVDWPPLQVFPAPNSNFDVVVNLSNNAPGLITGSKTVTVAPCPVGSYNDTEKGVCSSCATHNLFSLSAQVPCFNCINGAVCKRGLILPKTNYWMTNMLVPQLQWCPLDSACSFRHREAGLLETTLSYQQALTKEPESFTASASSYNTTFMNQQCATGYTGTFCGQCDNGYGLSGRKCIKCNGRGGTSALFLLCMLFLVTMISVTMFTHVKGSRLLSVGEASRVFISGAITGGVMHSNGAIPHDGHSDPVHDGSPWHVDEDGQRPHLFDLALVLDNAHKQRQHGRPPSGLDARTINRLAAGATPTVNGRQVALEATLEEQQAAEYFLLTAMIKILVTYVQLVGMLPGLKLRWPAELRRFLFFVDYTSCAGWLPLSCVLHGSEQSKATTTTVMYVWVFPVCVILLMVLLWALILKPFLAASSLASSNQEGEGMVTRRSQNSTDEAAIVFHTSFENTRGLAKKRAVAAVVQCVFYLYPFVTIRIMQVFVCMQVGRMSRTLWDAYKNFTPTGLEPVAPAFYWLQSSAVQCFKDPAHRNLAITLGVLGTSFWIVGVPLLLLWGAYCHRNSNRLANGALSWGFVYLEYRPELWYWEFMVCLRKLSVMICTQLLAFGRGPLSAGQLYASMVFVVFGWLLHEVFRPFTDTVLASMDRCSSFGVVVALIVIAFKLNSQSETTIDTALMVVVLLVVLSALLFLLARIVLQVLRLHRGWHYYNDERSLATKDVRGSDGKFVVGVDAQPGLHNRNSSGDWFGSAVEAFLETTSGLFRRNRNPLNDLAKRAWTRPPMRQSNSLEREMRTGAVGRVMA